MRSSVRIPGASAAKPAAGRVSVRAPQSRCMATLARKAPSSPGSTMRANPVRRTKAGRPVSSVQDPNIASLRTASSTSGRNV